MLVATIDHGGTMTDPDDDAGDDEVGPDAEWGRLVGEVGRATIGDPRIARLVFVPAAVPHPFEDAVEVFERAATQLLAGSAERPVAFLGYHAMNRLTRSREAVGFLVTDRAVHVRDAPSGVILRAPVRRIPLVRGPEGPAASAAATVAAAAGGFACSTSTTCSLRTRGPSSSGRWSGPSPSPSSTTRGPRGRCPRPCPAPVASSAASRSSSSATWCGCRTIRGTASTWAG